MSVILLLCLLLLFIFLMNTLYRQGKTNQMQTENNNAQIAEIAALFKNDPAKWVYNACVQEGFSALVAGFVVAQCAFETGNFCAPLCTAYNNCSGIKYTAAGKNLCGANIWQLSNGFAAYSSVKYWLLDYIRVISLSRYGNISYSQTLADFVNCLWEGGYFGYTYPNGEEQAQNYYNGCKHYYTYYKDLFAKRSQGLI